MKLNAIKNIYGLDSFLDDLGQVYMIKKGLNVKPTGSESIAIAGEVSRLKATKVVADHNKIIILDIKRLDLKRIRPLSEGDSAYLTKLNQQIAALRAQIK